MTKKLTQKQITHFKNIFIKQKEEIIDFCHKNQEVPQIDTDGDEIDVIQANILHNIDKKILEREANKLIKVNSALAKISNGTYGLCEDCDDLISIKRLEARPEAEFCITCAEKLELEAKIMFLKNS